MMKKTVPAIIAELEATNSRNEKVAILKENADNDTLKAVIEHSLNPFILFGIKKIPPYTPSVKVSWTMIQPTTIDQALDQIKQFIVSRKYTGNDAIDYLRGILNRMVAEDALIIERVIQKDMKCGVQESTVNKIWPGLIPKFPVMLASKQDEKSLSKIKFPAFVQTKFDGMRVNAMIHKNTGIVEFFSRNGKPVDCGNRSFVAELMGLGETYFELHPDEEVVVIDGELLAKDESGKLRDRKTSNGICNKAIRETISDIERDSLCMAAWDLISGTGFDKGFDAVKYDIRYEELIVCNSDSNFHLSIAHNDVVNTIEEAAEISVKNIANGLEGIILKNIDGSWEDKRSKNQVKMKQVLDADVLCTGTREGTGKFVGKIGALICESGDGAVKFQVGSGFSDADREIDPSEYIGKIVTVQYNEVIQRKDGSDKSLFLPIFVEVRHDKNSAEIIA